MHGDAHQPEANKARRVELILQELESLPTLSSVAVRLLELTADEDADAREVVELVATDPALASKVLAMCRCHDRGRASRVTTIDRAVLLLGFDAVRYAVLSTQVFDTLDRCSSPAGEVPLDQPIFDREAAWLHALGVAVVSERIAAAGTQTRDLRTGEAFMAGLLHDIGHLVLHVLLPESFDRVCRVAETHRASLNRACRQIIGLDTHTAGKRLAEHWGLPQTLVDVIWLNGQPFEALPDVPHRTLIAVVSLADALVRSHYITPGAHWLRPESLATLCIPVGIQHDELGSITADLHDEVTGRATALGLNVEHDPSVLLRSICRANESLARANAGMRQRESVAQRQGIALRAIRAFHDALANAETLLEVLGEIARSASSVMNVETVGALFESVDGQGWQLVRLRSSGRPFGCRMVEIPAGAIPPASIARDLSTTVAAQALLPWLDEHLGTSFDLADLRVLPLSWTGVGSNALLVLEAAGEPIDDREELEELIRSWEAALAAGAQHDGAAALTEQLAEANRILTETQEALARSQMMATLGEVAAGAAHEMNNPLAVISGRAQILAGRVQETQLRRMAGEILAESHRLSDMITALRSFAEPIEPRVRTVDLADFVMRIVQQHGPADRQQPQVNTIFTESLSKVRIDPDLVGCALGELVRNAVESKGSQHIELRVQTDPLDDRLKIEVRDDGAGLSEHALRHAFDPFFSAKPAGRQPGLGLARARRCVEAHTGRITLVNGPNGGAIATIWLTRWRADDLDHRDAA